MALPEKREHPSTYVVEDRSNKEELKRLMIQDEMLTKGMGGVFPEQTNPMRFHRVLDIGCGSGSWVIEAARTYPAIALFGIDISQRMIEYAREQGRVQGVGERVEFTVMDALRMLEYPANFFDLVNLRLGVSWMRTWDWPKLLSEMQRVTRPNGVVRVSEPDIIHESNSPALTQWHEMDLCALYRSGHLFELDTTGLTAHLVPRFTQYGIRQVQTKVYPLVYQARTPQGQAYFEDVQHGMKTVRPFFQKWGCISQDYDAICKQAIEEMKQSDFHVIWNMHCVWGERP